MEGLVPKNRLRNSAKMSHALRYELREPVAKTEPQLITFSQVTDQLSGCRFVGTAVGNSSASGESSLNPSICKREMYDYSLSQGRG